MLTRRTFLGSAAATAALFGASPFSRAEVGPDGKRFLFLHAEGGWDPLAVFAPLFGAESIEMEPDAEPWTIGGLSLVDSPGRPVTRAFFEQHHSKIALLNGVSVRSVNHETCSIVALTGATSADRPDFPTILGYSARDETSLPHLVMSGPVLPGPYSVFVSDARGRLQEAIDGSLLLYNDRPLRLPASAPGHIVDRYLVDRVEALQRELPGAGHGADYREALARSRALIDSRYQLQLRASDTFGGRARTAIDALSAGLCRCASVGTGFEWDTHQTNSEQTGLFEGFFADVGAALDLLAITPDANGKPLAESTIVVVMSEMGRTPAYNSTGGRDHWPFTTLMLMGPGIAGDRGFGGYSDLYAGIGVDQGGDPDPTLPGIPAEAVGATLLTLGGVDPAEYLHVIDPIPGVMT